MSTVQRQLHKRSHNRFWKNVTASSTNLLGFVLTSSFIVVAVLAPLLSPYSPVAMTDGLELSPPSTAHPFGTDEFGRDILSRVLYGSRISMLVGFGGVLTAALVGTLLGLISGYSGQRSLLDLLVMRIMDTLLAFPGILIGIVTVVLLGASAANVAIAVAIANVPLVTRLVRAETLREKEREYVSAAVALGAPRARILLVHLLPNTVSVIIVQIATSLGAAILLEAALSFLGLGAQPPLPSWGSMLRESRRYLAQAPWYAVAPGAALTLLIIGVNYFANALRQSFKRGR